MARASARHILVSTEQECLDLKQQIADGADFAELARNHSSCPSGRQGGALGEFSEGQMVPEFDAVVFNEAVGVVHGPVKTQFGYHLVELRHHHSRTELAQVAALAPGRTARVGAGDVREVGAIGDLLL